MIPWMASIVLLIERADAIEDGDGIQGQTYVALLQRSEMSAEFHDRYVSNLFS